MFRALTMSCFIPTGFFCKLCIISAIEMVLENNENHLADEIDKVKDRLKTISSSLENQQTFLRLIIQVQEKRKLLMTYVCMVCPLQPLTRKQLNFKYSPLSLLNKIQNGKTI